VVLRADGTASDDLRRFAMSLSGQLPAAALNRVIAPAAAQGMLAFDLSLDGPPTLSALSGRVSTGDGRLLLPEQNLAFSNLAARATLSGGQATLSATGQVDGGGRVTVDGPVSLSPPFGADLSITAVDVMLRDPMLYETRASGRLTLRGPLAGGALAAGRITLAETNIRVPETGLSGSEPIPEITHVGPSAEVLRTRDRAGLTGGGDAARGAGGPVYGLDVEVAAPNRIFVRGRGLDAEFGGAIRLRGTTSDVVPAGQFSLVRGRLDILSKRLELDEAEFTLRGALVPWLRLVARNEADDATLYVSLTGPADSPEIRFYAEPELPEDEVLARLLFGKGIENLSPLQAAQLAAAVARLAGRGGLDLIGGLRRSFGLDDLDVRQTEEGGAAVTAGRYITENVYTDVTVGENTGEVTLNLDITPNITARGSADTEGETSLGIFFERDY
jgi:translocation and assembly module TamB